MVISLSAVAGYRFYRLYTPRVNAPERVDILFRDKSDLQQILRTLNGKSVFIDNREAQWAAGILRLRTVRRGNYTLQGRYSYFALLGKLARGEQDPIKIVVPPGVDPQTIAESLAARLHFTADSVLNVLSNAEIMAAHGISVKEAPGRLWPDTYMIYWTASAPSVVARMLDAFSANMSKFDFNAASRNGLKSVNDVLTLASIVEWESKDADERKMIAGLYLNRLRKGMRLQADPTVAYAIGSRRRLTFADYQTKHPYNTYQIDGLPPGPINNPSRSAIDAALNPSVHNYIYMVASPSGKHVFTSTWEEHKIESEKWRRWLRQQVKIREARERAALSESQSGLR